MNNHTRNGAHDSFQDSKPQAMMNCKSMFGIVVAVVVVV